MVIIFLPFSPIAADNFICFPVDRYTGMESAVYGIISFKEDNGTKNYLHAIYYDPWSSRGKPQGNPRIPSTRSAPVSRQMTAATDERRDFDESMYNNFVTNEFAISITYFNIKYIVVFKKIINRIKCKKGGILHTKGTDIRPIITKSCVFESSRTISGRSFRWVCILNGN